MLTPTDILTRAFVAVYGRRCGYHHVDPWLIVAQARLETSNYTSNVYLEK
jgi:hypothetical protein